MAGRIILPPTNPALSNLGTIDAGATQTFYEAGTLVLQPIYTSNALSTPLPNPLPCDSAGRYPIIWAPDNFSYDVKWTLSDGTVITFEDITPQINGGLFVDGGVDISGNQSKSGQIKFPATQNPSTDPNTLDDYEEGIWTPTEESGSGANFEYAFGYYTKIGRLVNISWDCKYNAFVSAFNAVVGGLPFAQKTGTFSIGAINTDAGIGIIARANGGPAKQIFLLKNTNVSATVTEMGGKILAGTITYFV